MSLIWVLEGTTVCSSFRDNLWSKRVEENLVRLAPPMDIQNHAVREEMELVYQRCCWIDIHKKSIMACLITQAASGQRHKELRSFRTVTAELLQLLNWLKSANCTYIVMEIIGV